MSAEDLLLVALERNARLVEALEELHAAGFALAPLVGYIQTRECVRWEDAMGAACEALERETADA